MAAAGFNSSPFILPNASPSAGEAMQNQIAINEREKRFQYEKDYRVAKDKEQDDWKKLQLIQELTDIDKYQTGEQAADAIGFKKAQDIMQKFTAQAGSMTPAELQYKISQEIGKTTIGMQSMKDELVQSESKIQQYKRMYPSLNDAELKRVVRADIFGRRISGSEFANITDANQPSQLNLDDPDFISDFIDVNKGLKDAVVNPKNIQKGVNVLRGSEKSYVNYEGDLPFYMKDDFKTQGGFYNQKEEPTMSLKTSTIPQGAFSGANQDIDVLDEGSFRGLLSEGAEVEPALRKLAKTKYRDYSSMSNAEKEIAMRDVAKDFITPYAANYKYRSKSATKPPHYSNTTINKSGSDVNWNDIYTSIDDTVKEMEGKGSAWTPVTILPPDAKEIVLASVKNANGGTDIPQDDLRIIRGDDGSLRVFDKDGNFKTYISKKATNIKGNQPLGVKAKQEALKDSGGKTDKTAEDLRKKYNY